MRIRYVVSSMVFWWREHNLSFEQECEYLRSLGFGIELWPTIRGQNDCRYDKQNWPRLLEATEGMLISMRSRNDDPTLQQWAEQIECAKLLGANIVTDLRSFGIPDSMEIDGCNFSAEIVKIAADSNVQLCIETGDLNRVGQVAERFDYIRYCLDIGCANLDPVYPFREYVDQLADKITHLHLCDNYGRTDDHEPPGLKGGISRENWDYLLEALNKYDDDVIASLEMQPPMPADLIRQACEFLFDELNWPNRPQKAQGRPIVIYNPT